MSSRVTRCRPLPGKRLRKKGDTRLFGNSYVLSELFQGLCWAARWSVTLHPVHQLIASRLWVLAGSQRDRRRQTQSPQAPWSPPAYQIASDGHLTAGNPAFVDTRRGWEKTGFKLTEAGSHVARGDPGVLSWRPFFLNPPSDRRRVQK